MAWHCRTSWLGTVGHHGLALSDIMAWHCRTSWLGTVGHHGLALSDIMAWHCRTSWLGTVGHHGLALSDIMAWHCRTLWLGTVALHPLMKADIWFCPVKKKFKFRKVVLDDWEVMLGFTLDVGGLVRHWWAELLLPVQQKQVLPINCEYSTKR